MVIDRDVVANDICGGSIKRLDIPGAVVVLQLVNPIGSALPRHCADAILLFAPTTHEDITALARGVRQIDWQTCVLPMACTARWLMAQVCPLEHNIRAMRRMVQPGCPRRTPMFARPARSGSGCIRQAHKLGSARNAATSSDLTGWSNDDDVARGNHAAHDSLQPFRRRAGLRRIIRALPWVLLVLGVVLLLGGMMIWTVARPVLSGS
jgi:hypothetical protein